MLENLITVMWVYMSSLILIHIPSQIVTATYPGDISPRKQCGDVRIKGSSDYYAV